MTLFISVAGVEQIVAEHGIANLFIFSKRIDAVTAFDMAWLSKQCELRFGRAAGKNVIKAILVAINKAALLGSISPCPATRFTPARPKLTIGEFKKILCKFSLDERRLIVVALATGKTLTECSFFQHEFIKQEANINNWPAELRRFVNKIPRHIRSPFVFWTNDRNKSPIALVGFEAKFRQVTKASWPVFAKLCEDLVPMDCHEDAREFATMFVLESVHAQ